MESVKVRLTAQVTTARFGEQMPGTIMVTDSEHARYLVHDLGAAEYMDKKLPKHDETPAKAEAKAPAKKARGKNDEVNNG